MLDVKSLTHLPFQKHAKGELICFLPPDCVWDTTDRFNGLSTVKAPPPHPPPQEMPSRYEKRMKNLG